MRTVAIVQARVGSTRLPGKVLMDVAGRTMLNRVLERIAQAAGLDAVVVATTAGADDDAVVAECRRLGFRVSRGSVADVLDRFVGAALTAQAEAIVRITADCPLVDPALVGEAVSIFQQAGVDYVSNGLKDTYPRGLDVEVVSMCALQKAWREARHPYQRVHVTPYLYENPGLFSLRSIEAEADYSHHRWTVDTPGDLALVREIYSRVPAGGSFGWREVLDLLARAPELAQMNAGTAQKALQEG